MGDEGTSTGTELHSGHKAAKMGISDALRTASNQPVEKVSARNPVNDFFCVMAN